MRDAIAEYLERRPKVAWMISIGFGLIPIIVLDMYTPGWSALYVATIIVVGVAIATFEHIHWPKDLILHWTERFWPLPERPEGFNNAELWNGFIETQRGSRRFIIHQIGFCFGILLANALFIAAVVIIGRLSQ